MISDCTFAAIDFESAGAERGKTDVPVQIGLATWSATSGHADHFTSYIYTERPITWAAQKVHGISSDDLADAPQLMMLWPQIKRTLSQRIVVAHGHGTEKRYLRAFPAHNFGPWVDTLLLARAAWPKLPSHALGEVCEHFELTEKISVLVPNKTWHDALYDTTASLILLEYLIDTFGLNKSSIDQLLHPDTKEWYRLRK